MKYIKINEEEAISREIIKPTHPYPNKDGEVIFDADILSIFKYKGGDISDLEYEELTTKEALNILSTWQQQ